MGELACPLRIRAHHLLCLLGFRGLGYSREFIAMMEKVVDELRSDTTLPITLVAEGDVICASCPHYKGNKCLKEADFEQRVKAQDLEVLQRLDLEIETRIPVGEAWAKIKEKLSSREIEDICRGCEWLRLGYCADGLERLETG